MICYKSHGESSNTFVFNLSAHGRELFHFLIKVIHREPSNMCLKIKCGRRQDLFATPGMGMGGNYVYKSNSNLPKMTHTNSFSSIRKQLISHSLELRITKTIFRSFKSSETQNSNIQIPKFQFSIFQVFSILKIPHFSKITTLQKCYDIKNINPNTSLVSFPYNNLCSPPPSQRPSQQHS